MIRLTLRTLRYRKGGFVATFIALFFGAAIVMACGGLMETGVRTAVTPHRLAGAEIVVTGSQTYELAKENPADEEEDTHSGRLVEQVTLPSNLVGALAAMPGVEAAVPDMSFPATVGAVTTTGHGWESARLASLAGAAPAAGQVVLDTSFGKQPGDQVRIWVRGAASQFTVARVESLARPAFYVAPADAARLGKLTAVGVVVRPGTDVPALADRMEDSLAGKAEVLTGDDRGVAEVPAALDSSEMLIVLAGVFGGFAVMTLMLVVASTLGLSIRQRRREIALLRAVGTTPAQVRRMVFFEALVLSLLATLAAWLPGSLLGDWLFDQFTALGVVSPDIQFHQGWIPSVTGIGAALVASQVAAVAAARRAAQTRPTEALADAAVQRKWLTATRVVLASLCFAGGLALAIVTVLVMSGPIAASTAGPAVLLWATGMTLLAPGATRVVMAVLAWPVRALTSVPGYLAVSNAKVRRVQLAAAIAPVMLATGFATAQIYTQTTSIASAEQAYTENLRADAVLQSPVGGFSPDVVSRVRSVPGVAAASEWVTSVGFVEAPYDDQQPEDGLALQGVSPADAASLTPVDLKAGSLADLKGKTIALPSSHAAAMGVDIGSTITMRFGDGQSESTRIVALVNPKPNFEAALLPATLLATHTTAGAPQRILVQAAGDPAAMTAALAARFPELRVVDRSVLMEAYSDDQQTGAWINYLLAGMIILYTAISVINTLVVTTADRRREFGLMRLSGARRGQVMRMAGVEGAIVAVTGVLLGTVISAGTLVPFSIAAMGTPFPTGPLWIYLAVAGAAGLLTMTATLLPTWFALRPRPVETVIAP